jgi:hypothetical protein
VTTVARKKSVASRYDKSRAAAQLVLEIVAGSAKLVYHLPQETHAIEASDKPRGTNAMSGQLDHGYENAGGDFGEHLKTYKAFLNLVTYATGATVATLALLYFFLAR